MVKRKMHVNLEKFIRLQIFKIFQRLKYQLKQVYGLKGGDHR